ncbi:MAG: hypothetical protein ACK5DB_05630 [Ignavibacteria bacterium]
MKFKNSFNKNLLTFASSMMAAIVLFLYGSMFYTLLSQGKGLGWKDLLKPFSFDQVKDITAFIESIIIHVIEFCIDALKSFLNR